MPRGTDEAFSVDDDEIVEGELIDDLDDDDPGDDIVDAEIVAVEPPPAAPAPPTEPRPTDAPSAYDLARGAATGRASAPTVIGRSPGGPPNPADLPPPGSPPSTPRSGAQRRPADPGATGRDRSRNGDGAKPAKESKNEGGRKRRSRRSGSPKGDETRPKAAPQSDPVQIKAPTVGPRTMGDGASQPAAMPPPAAPPAAPAKQDPPTPPTPEAIPAAPAAPAMATPPTPPAETAMPEAPMPPPEVADEPPINELRQIAGLTAGSIMELLEDNYDFAEGDRSIGFSVTVDANDRVIVTPGSVPAAIDGEQIEEPTPIGSGVLDVGSARFVARKRQRLGAVDILEQHRDADEPEPIIAVPTDLTRPEPEQKKKRRRGKNRRKEPEAEHREIDVWAFMESIREVRAKVAKRTRYHHPDPTELAIHIETEAPTIGVRPYGHPLFAKVAVMSADIGWLPKFDDIQAIPDEVGYQLQSLLSLPSVPVVADLMIGPLGIVGARPATTACARHLMVSLYAASTDGLRLHVVTPPERRDGWAWARAIAPAAPLALSDDEQSVVVIDGMENFGDAGFDHEDAIDRTVSAVILADAVEELPSYCGTVLQVNDAGTAILTNHRGDVIQGTPIGLTTSTAAGLADALVPLVRQRQA
ncbi:MAG: hypothetical protein AAGD35_05765 [Actinomycetota bacterium]